MGIPFLWVTIVSLAFTIGRKDRFSIPGSDEVRLLGSWRCTRWGPVKSCSDCTGLPWTFQPVQLSYIHGPFFSRGELCNNFSYSFMMLNSPQNNTGQFLPAKTLTQLAQLEWPGPYLCCPLGYWGNFGPHHEMWALPAASVSWQLLGHGRYLVNVYPELERDSQQWIKDDHVHQWPLSGWK